uniref:Uncharacterized protein n=1 Tax=Vitis vinifera TaxID=29760 RepID=A5BDP0_VITVI|nr:hypothetical protein VITISV_042602 [Vitis vinifera]
MGTVGMKEGKMGMERTSPRKLSTPASPPLLSRLLKKINVFPPSLSSEYPPHGRPLPPEKPPSADLTSFSLFLSCFPCLPLQAKFVSPVPSSRTSLPSRQSPSAA